MSLSHSACDQSSPGACAARNESAEDADISGLLSMLASVTDPRSPQGIQHALQFVLAVCVVAMLAGAKNYREIAGQAADIPRPLLRKLGAGWCWFRLRYKYPSASTVRNVLTRVDAAQVDAITGAWLFAQARKSGKAEWEIAVDGTAAAIRPLNWADAAGGERDSQGGSRVAIMSVWQTKQRQRLPVQG